MNDLSQYRYYRPQMKTGDAIEWGGKGFLSRTIRMFTGQKVNHTSMVIRMDLFGLSDRVFVLEALVGGIDINLLSEELLRYNGRVFWLPLQTVNGESRTKMARFGFMSSSKRYDYRSLVANAFGPVGRDMSKLFCSEFYHYALIAGGVIGETWKAKRPGEFMELGCHSMPMRLI